MLTRSTKCKLTIFGISFILLSLLFSGCKLPTSRITVTRFSPEGEVPRKSNFTIAFSQPMVSPESVGVWIEPTFLEIEPHIEGKCKWISEQELRFYPEELLRPSTKYRLEILPQIVQMEGPRLSGKKVFEFYTARINIDNLAYDYRIDEKEPGLARIQITLEFNYEIVPSDLQEKLRLRFENGENIAYEIEQKSPSLILTAVSEPISLKDMDMKIHLHVDKNLKPVDGALGLLQDYDEILKMPARKKLVVESAFPECSKEANWITVKFSIPVNVEALKDFIQIEPHIDFYLQSRQRYVYIHGDFAASAEYTLTLKKGLPALNGSQLEKEFSTHVVMKELEPYFDFVTEGIFLPSKGNLNVGIQTVNIDKLELSVEKVFINNLVYFLNTNQMYSSYFNRDYLGKHVTREEIEIKGNRNTKVITTVNMADYLTEERQGIFVLILRRPEYRWDSKIKWVRMTDLGIIATDVPDPKTG